MRNLPVDDAERLVDNQSLCSLNLNYIYKDCGLIHRSLGDISFQKKELSCLLLMMDSWENAQEAGHDVFFLSDPKSTSMTSDDSFQMDKTLKSFFPSVSCAPLVFLLRRLRKRT